MMVKLRALALAGVFLLAGCTQTPTTGVEPGDGPAAQSDASESAELDCTNATTEAEQAQCADLEPDGPTEEATDPASQEPADEPEPEVATFKDKYTYADGVQVEVTKIKHGKTNAYETQIDNDAKITAADP